MPLNASRTDIPASYTNVVRPRGSGRPEDTIVYQFSSASIASDDVALAMAESLFDAAQRLSEDSGDESLPLESETFHVYGNFYDFEIGSDLYAQHESFKIWHLRVIVQDISSLGRRFNLRECTFNYRSGGIILLQGHLKNARSPPSPREAAPDPYIDDFLGDYMKYWSYGPIISHEATALAMQDIFNYGWNEMVAKQQSDMRLHLQVDHYSYLKHGIRFEVQTAEPGHFPLEDLMEAAYAIVSFSRRFEMRALKFVLATAEKPRVAGFVVPNGPVTLTVANLPEVI